MSFGDYPRQYRSHETEQEQAGKPAVALELYQRLLRDVPDSRQAEDLRNRVANLKSQTGAAKQ